MGTVNKFCATVVYDGKEHEELILDEISKVTSDFASHFKDFVLSIKGRR